MAQRALFHPEVLRQKTLALHPTYQDSRIRLDDDDRAVLRRVNGQATVGTVGGLTQLPEEVMMRIVLRLVARQKLVFADDLPYFDETALLAVVLTRVEGKPAAKTLRLDEIDETLLAAVDGSTRVRELAKLVPLDRERLLANVLRLLNAGLVRAMDAAQGARAARRAADPELALQRSERVAPQPAPATESDQGETAAPPAPSWLSRLRRPVAPRHAALALIVLGIAAALRVATGLVGAVETRVSGQALTVDGLADVIALTEIRLTGGHRWTAVARSSFRSLPRADRVKAAQELVSRVRAGGYREIVVDDETGAPLFHYESSVLTIADRAASDSASPSP